MTMSIYTSILPSYMLWLNTGNMASLSSFRSFKQVLISQSEVQNKATKTSLQADNSLLRKYSLGQITN